MYQKTLNYKKNSLVFFLKLINVERQNVIQTACKTTCIYWFAYLSFINGFAIQVSFTPIDIATVISSFVLLVCNVRRILPSSVVRGRTFSLLPLAPHFSSRFLLLIVSLRRRAKLTLTFTVVKIVIVIFSLLKVTKFTRT